MIHKITIDFETKSELDVRDVGAAVYAAHPSTDVLCMAFAYESPRFENDGGVWTPGANKYPTDLYYKRLFNDDHPIEAHNVFFERMIWRIMVEKYGFPEIDPHRWRCSMAKASAAALPRKLEQVAKILELKNQKDMVGHKDMMKLTSPIKPRKESKNVELALHDHEKRWNTDPEKLKNIYAYCLQDVRTEVELSDTLPDLIPDELKIWQLDQLINLRGVPVDRDMVDGAVALVDQIEAEAVVRLREITAGAVDSVGQIKRIREFAAAHGVKMTNLDKHAVTAALNDPSTPEVVVEVLKIRQANGLASVKKYHAMKRRANADGRIRDALIYCGAGRSGRWSSNTVQFQNVVGGFKDPDVQQLARDLIAARDIEGIRIFFGDVFDMLSKSIRGAVCAPPGREFKVADYKAIEARILFWLVGQKDGLDQFRRGDDIYMKLAKKIDPDNPSRDLGKRSILGFGYGMAEHKAVATWAKYGLIATLDKAAHAKRTYRRTYSKVPKYWRRIERAAKHTIKTKQPSTAGRISFSASGRWLYMELPSGRRLAYRDPRIVDGEIRYMGLNSITHQWESQKSYGGKLTENACQAVARDIMAHAMLELENAGYDVILTVHDEIISETAAGFGTLKEFCSIMEIIPPWVENLPLKVEGWIMKRYRKE